MVIMSQHALLINNRVIIYENNVCPKEKKSHTATLVCPNFCWTAFTSQSEFVMMTLLIKCMQINISWIKILSYFQNSTNICVDDKSNNTTLKSTIMFPISGKTLIWMRSHNNCMANKSGLKKMGTNWSKTAFEISLPIILITNALFKITFRLIKSLEW